MSVHIVLDNYATHKTAAVKRWFLRHPECYLHFIPTSSSWLNQVERFFAAITEQRIRRGVFTSVPQLERAVAAYLAEHNQNQNRSLGQLPPTPFSNGFRGFVNGLLTQDTSKDVSFRPCGGSVL